MADSADIKSFPRFKTGDILRHDHVNGIVDALKRDLEVVGPGVRQTGRKVQIIPQAERTISLATADSSIPASSGGAPGTGTATIQWYNETSGNIESTNEKVKVINPARTTTNGSGDIRSGQMCLVFQDTFGSLIITPIEC